MKTVSRLVLLPVLLIGNSTLADSATWNLGALSGNWNSDANWTPATIPNGPNDIATFDASDITKVAILRNTRVNAIVFNPGASAFTIKAPSTNRALSITGTGITNHSGLTQTFVTSLSGNLVFDGRATAGSGTAFKADSYGIIHFAKDTTAGSATFFILPYGQVAFSNDSTAGDGYFVCDGALEFAPGNIGTPSAGNATIILNGGKTTSGNVGLAELDGTTAGTATFTMKGGAVAGAFGGLLIFGYGGDAENATLIAEGGAFEGGGGSIRFQGDSTGGAARVELLGNASLNMFFHEGNLTIGSLEGSGTVFSDSAYAYPSLTVGTNNLSTAFAGVIEGEGSLIKTGTGKLTLSGANTYTGGTTVRKGVLLVNSGTGSGPVWVNSGALGGSGTISGAVTIGMGASVASLAPGNKGGKYPLRIQSMLTFNSLATYKVDLDSTNGMADSVTARGVAIDSGASIAIDDLGAGSLTQGTTLTLISNTAGTPIGGTFSNLADGSTLTVGSNTYQVSYEGGDGNDLTLTVVP